VKLLDIEMQMALNAGDGRAAVRGLLSHFGIPDADVSDMEIRWRQAPSATGCNVIVDHGIDVYLWRTGANGPPGQWRSPGKKPKIANVWWVNEVR